ncbi:MAG TPA: OsmC family protein [Pseudonocardia sp.]|nr:OsmC family protein [Pseudonocardia sp.]
MTQTVTTADSGARGTSAGTQTIRNGVDTATMFATLDAIKAQPELATFRFRARNTWQGGAHNRSVIKDFYGAGGEDGSRTEGFTLDAGEPPVLLGTNEGPNPAEYLLHALAACVTTSLVYSAAARRVPLTSVSSELEGEMDVRGALGLDDDYRNGFTRITMKVTISGDAPPEKLREVVMRGRRRSAVFDMVTNGVPVELDVVTD